MTPAEREQVVELLELAHGYAIAGSIMPFKTACVELDLKGSEIAKQAACLIDLARNELKIEVKPSPSQYKEAIELALARVEDGTWL